MKLKLRDIICYKSQPWSKSFFYNTNELKKKNFS